MKRLPLVLVTTAVLAAGAGCSNLARLAKYGSPLGDEVTPVPNRDVAALTADDVVLVMRRAGFTDDELLKLGPALRNAIATNGAARIRYGKKTEALVAVVGDFLHVSSRRRGSFIYDLKKQRCQ